jgi:hypothetical protein
MPAPPFRGRFAPLGVCEASAGRQVVGALPLRWLQDLASKLVLVCDMTQQLGGPLPHIRDWRAFWGSGEWNAMVQVRARPSPRSFTTTACLPNNVLRPQPSAGQAAAAGGTSVGYGANGMLHWHPHFGPLLVCGATVMLWHPTPPPLAAHAQAMNQLTYKNYATDGTSALAVALVALAASWGRPAQAVQLAVALGGSSGVTAPLVGGCRGRGVPLRPGESRGRTGRQAGGVFLVPSLLALRLQRHRRLQEAQRPAGGAVQLARPLSSGC